MQVFSSVHNMISAHFFFDSRNCFSPSETPAGGALKEATLFAATSVAMPSARNASSETLGGRSLAASWRASGTATCAILSHCLAWWWPAIMFLRT